MTLSTYLFYLVAVLLLIVTPGPTMLMCLTNSVNHGPARAIASLSGALVANTAIMALSALGLGAVLAASEAAFTILKFAGAAYLIWLGIKTFSSDEGIGMGTTTSPRTGSLFLQGVLVGASNPKSLLFFTAFFPQFIDPGRPFAPQFAVLAATFVVGDFIVMALGAVFVGRIAPQLRQPRVVRWINRTCGGLFALLGCLLLATRRSA